LGILLDAAHESLVLIDREGTILLSNTVGAQRLGKSVQEFVGTCLYDHFPPDVGPSRKEQYNKVAITGQPVYFQDTRAGRFFEQYCYPVSSEEGTVDRVAIFAHEITGRKQAERTLQLNVLRTKALLDLHLKAGEPQQKIFDFAIDAAQRITESGFSFAGLMNEAETAMEIHAWSKDVTEECSVTGPPIHFPIGKAGIWGDCVRQRKPVLVNDYGAPRPAKKGYPEGHVPIRRFLSIPVFDSGRIVLVAAVANKQSEYRDDDIDALTALMEKTWDIVRHQKARATLIESEAKYRSIFENAMEGIFQTSPEGRFLSANPAMARMAGYDSPEDLISCITDMATQLYVNPADRTRFTRIMAEQGTVMDFEVEHHRKDGSTFWALINARAVRDDSANILYFEGTVEDVTARKKAEQRLKESLDNLHRAIGVTIQTIASTVETKDPYTAGHQKRSTDLAQAIAIEMGLPAHTIEGIRMAGSIHDIGKISIPAEILSKPTRLTAIELELIKTHARHGCDILKDVESPWPLAEIILQHHERMDGSGYPRGLKGDEILMEARIIAVADVVESMASHRPYRPALGIGPALREIEENAGILYDREVAGVCLKLFREKGFSFV